MKNIKMIFVKMILLVGIFGSFPLAAKVRAVTSQREFEQIVTEKGLCAVLFYDAGDKQSGVMRDQNRRLQRMFEDVSNKREYDAADVVFVKVNSARKEFDTVLNQYGITQVPTFLLFSNGNIVMSQGKPCMLIGFVTRGALESLVDICCGGEIKRLDEQHAAMKQQRIEAEKARWPEYFYSRTMFVSDYDTTQRSRE
jgi:hypothetical protein